jgi:hypothetical protein
MKKGSRVFSKIILVSSLILLCAGTYGQKITSLDTSSPVGSASTHAHTEKCAHTLIQSKVEKELGFFGTEAFFEGWIDQKIAVRRRNPQIARTQADQRIIPVVVHVIHNGTAVGTAANIPDAQILEQIRILNEDFRRLNPDASETPAEFLPVAADANIEFVLAKQDPNGLPTTGIVRVQGTKTSYDPNSDAILISQLSQWNPEEYMNIWVVPLMQPYIGYSSFPISDLPGLDFSPSPASMDGVTIDYRFFGVGGSASSASLGRTATHEVGHFFGLRHIWGDGGCDVDDFVVDTPGQDSANNTCNDNPSKVSCGNNNMIQNFMDYTPDACMNLFTAGQVERFDVVLANSPRRLTLVNNRATKDPVLASRDLSLFQIIQPVDAICDLNVLPEVVVQNTGLAQIQSARIEFLRNGSVIQSRRFQLNLSTGEFDTLAFDPYLLQAGNNRIEFKITEVNDLEDQNTSNNSKFSNPVLQGEISLPYQYNPQSFPGDWVISNPDESTTWQSTMLTLDGQSQPAIYLDNYDYDAPGQVDYLISPIIDLSKYPNAQLVFEVSHAPYDQTGYQDELLVAVSQGCSANFDLEHVKYQKSGMRLETAEPSPAEFVPTSTDQFRTEIFNLSEFKDQGKVRVSIIAKNAYGNNVYIRNIRILPTEEFSYKIKIEDILKPTPISSGWDVDEVVRVKNIGNLPIKKFVIGRSTNSFGPESYLVSDVDLAPDEQIDIDVTKSTQQGKNRLRYTVSEPNFDQNGGTPEVFDRYNLEDADTTIAPWRQRFEEGSSLGNWLTINPENDLQAWTVTSIAGGNGPNNVAVLENGVAGNSYWLGTPEFALDMSRQASIFFDLAAGQVNPGTRLSLLASRDAGINYSVVWSATGQELSSVSSGAANPTSSEDYVKNYVNLSDFAGHEGSNVRLAFVLDVVGTDNSPVYLDNIELFLNANSSPVIPTERSSILYPNPAREYFNLVFNLPDREDLTIQIISATGAVVHEVSYPGTLNQTYTFSTELFRTGVYVIKISSNSIVETKRLIIN